MDYETEDLWVSEPLDRQTPLHQQLLTLDASLRCEICRGFFSNPVSLNKCQHSFCSECIRNSLTEQYNRTSRKMSCPTCRAQLDSRGHERNYRPNRSLARIVAAFASLRAPLHQRLAQQQSPEYDETADANRRGTKRGASSTTTLTQLAPKRLLPYDSYKKRALQQKCHEEGISATGSDQQLKERHKRFVTFWNAHTDNLDGTTKTPHAIVSAFNAQEAERERHAYNDAATKNAVAKVFEKAQSGKADGRKTSFEANLDEGFKKLIAEARNRQKRRKENPESVDKERTPSHENVAENTNKKSPDNFCDNSLSPSADSPAGVTASSVSSPEVGNDAGQALLQSPVDSPVATPVDEKKMPHRSPQEEQCVEMDEDEVVVVATNPYQPAPAYVSRVRSTRGASLIGPWTCEICTFINEKNKWSTAKCEMCETPRPKPSAA